MLAGRCADSPSLSMCLYATVAEVSSTCSRQSWRHGSELTDGKLRPKSHKPKARQEHVTDRTANQHCTFCRRPHHYYIVGDKPCSQAHNKDDCCICDPDKKSGTDYRPTVTTLPIIPSPHPRPLVRVICVMFSQNALKKGS